MKITALLAATALWTALAFGQFGGASRSAVQDGRYNYGVSTNLTDSYTAALTPAMTAVPTTVYKPGMVVHILFTTANTGACTLSLDGLTAKAIKTSAGSDPVDGQIPAGGTETFIYNGTNWVLQTESAVTPPGGGDVLGAANLTTAGRMVSVSAAGTVTEQAAITAAAGVITATGFSGPLTGNVTGNASGSAATITGSLVLANTPLTTRGDILVATTATPVPGKLAKGTQYQTLQGGATDPGYDAVHLDQATAVTGVLPNGNTTAASANTASAIVARDASGNFAAGTITASLTGNASGSAGTVTSIATHASSELTDTAALVRGAASLTTDHKVVSVSTTDGSLEEIPNQTANYIYAGPASGGAAAPTFRAAVAADVPDISSTYETVAALGTWVGSANITTLGTITSGTWTGTAIGMAKGGLGADFSGIAKGGMLSGSGAGALALTVVGTDGQIWTADAASAGGAKWTTVAWTGDVVADTLTTATAVPKVGSVAKHITESGVLIDASNNITTPGTISTGYGGSVAGATSWGQGTLPASFPANSFSIYAPTSITTAYQWLAPAADAAGAIVSSGAGTPGVLSIVAVASANTASAIVQRDGSGNFAAGTITASLTGNASGSAATITGSLALANTPLTTRGDIFIATTATPILGRLGIGAAGTVLVGGTEPAYSATPTLGTAGSVVGTLAFANATSGSITVSPPTGALGTIALTLPTTAGTLATRADNLSVFAATTSAQLAGVLSDEAGSGVAVFDTSPAFTTDLHCATAGGCTLGTAALPASSIYIGGAATNNIRLTGSSAAARVVTVPDVGTDTGATVVLAPTSTTTTYYVKATAVAGLYTTAAIAAGDVPTLNQNTSGTAAALSATLTEARFPAMDGDVTNSAGDLTTTIASGAVTPTKSSTALKRDRHGLVVGDPAGDALATGVLGYLTVANACTIIGWDILVDAGTATVDIWKIATGTAIPTDTNSITASAQPAISTGTAIHSTTLTGWTTTVAAFDIIGFNLDAVATAKFIYVDFYCDRT